MDIESIKLKAEEINSKYNPDGLVPFPFQKMAAELGDVDILFLDTSNSKISGAIYSENDRFVIIVNKQKPETRQYFTLGHEFGHYFLHKEWLTTNGGGFVDIDGELDTANMLLRPDEPPVDHIMKEREANNFAAELIMPEDKVREAWDISRDVEDCANIFQVSKAAMAVRLERLHL